MEYRERSRIEQRSPLLCPPPTPTHNLHAPNKRGRNRAATVFFFSFFFFSPFSLRHHVRRLLTSFLTSAIHSLAGYGEGTLPFRCSSRGKDFHRDILRREEEEGRRYVSFRFEEKEKRWYLRNKRSRLNALLAIRAINGASTLISCSSDIPIPTPSPPTTVSVRHKHGARRLVP